jgi:hypothetical protein
VDARGAHAHVDGILIEDTRVVEILQERVDDLAAFRTALARAAGG